MIISPNIANELILFHAITELIDCNKLN